MLFGIDAEWGLYQRLKEAHKFPWAMTLGAIQDDKLIYEMGAKIAEDADVVITGTGSVVLNNVRLTSGKTIPAGASPDNDHPVREATVVTLPNGSETTIPAGEKIPRGAKLKAPLVSSANNTWHNVTFSTGDVIPKTDSNNKQAVLAKETSISQIVAKGDVVKLDFTG